MNDLLQKIKTKTGMDLSVISNIVQLLDEGNTVPFIARYRKEMTKGATDEQLRDFNEIYTYTKNLEARKEAVIRLIDEKGLLTPELKQEILEADTLARVEDLYRPFKEKKNTKATIAKAKGLEPLAKILATATLTKEEFETKAKEFIKDTGDIKTSVKTLVEAIQGAKDIVAEDVSDHANLREKIKTHEENHATIVSRPTKTFEENGVYKIYKDYSKSISEIPSYAYLAINRAENEKQLNIGLNMSDDKIESFAKNYFLPNNANTSSCYLVEAIEDGLKRLLLPSIEREIRSDKKRWADEAAIKVFGENLKNLLLTPPVKGLTVLGFDPAFRTGCKLAVVDKTGKFLYNTVIYPTEPQNKIEEAEQTLLKLVKNYSIDLIVIGNGTASRESEKIIANFIKKNKLKVQYMITSEAGASVYSASKLAQQEYPDLDVTIRGAISIAHRVQDPLAELTKIDPKSIGVGQYQHDVDQKFLKEKLDEKVEDVVNSVGVDVNTASYTLLQYIAGLSEKVAQNITKYRDENGEFTSKAQLKKVPGLGAKSYEQAIGFIRIKGGKEPLDATGIHPEIHKQVYELIEKELGIKKKDLVLPIQESVLSQAKNTEILKSRSQKYEIGFETLQDVVAELQRPGLDPREEIETPVFKSDILEISDLQEGMELEGVIRNVTDFGAFVDIGLHNDGLVHKSQMADFFVKNPIDVVSVGQRVKVKVLNIDLEREKVGLSMKDSDNSEILDKKREQAKEDYKKQEKRNEFQIESEADDNSSISGNISFS
ncbi:MAG: RNA-binding transcriptional accessory protein [Candidatus Absconditabacterales bacterium]|nr:RNA-binding transcriptional accessory protein [Candidatus Absconditabacterales bacterium]